ncbi:MOR signalling network scaffold, leucine-rich repeat protein Sog2 [Schizosaccharomyces pombe]|uniref:Leucine-rich repeat-containing protein sog2 n=1 Tax=Schizosaccharomyces pombe (strain 972 / ATCC 24843) TaxID=284812 RepID=SOG2_SCHPO|nr:putative leucine-rich repeat protein Sog2 [Schizosaccharomyces pombe]O94294.1 RecName: Full=Leucine-rich repeat-containing protein sog2 [Schizosaccharomyces pombe 972h-]CAA21894.1 leucine-rich repeat protein Sog2 (predicted) [Schizosaccharomyces pombe]|eukprot:NP_596483.1 putative leucine-rich repeat protein Sog2 [Schizosaccharomyces pombe]
MSAHEVSSTKNSEIERIIKEAEDAGPENALTLDLSHLNLRELPYEQLERIQGRIARLALGHNFIKSIGPEILKFTRLRYLNIRSNVLREFPESLCRLESLEILDISRNKIKQLPESFGALMNLKVLSISKNRLFELPTYIAHMPNLEILKIENNHIVFPPPHIANNDLQDSDMQLFIANIKGYLSRNESVFRTRSESTVSAALSASANLSHSEENDSSVVDSYLFSAPSDTSHAVSPGMLTFVTPSPHSHSPAGHQQSTPKSTLSKTNENSEGTLYDSNVAHGCTHPPSLNQLNKFHLDASPRQARPRRSVSLATGLNSPSVSKPPSSATGPLYHSPQSSLTNSSVASADVQERTHNTNGASPIQDQISEFTDQHQNPSNNDAASTQSILKTAPTQLSASAKTSAISLPEVAKKERNRSNSTNDDYSSTRLPSSVLHRLEALKEARKLSEQLPNRIFAQDPHPSPRLKKEETHENGSNLTNDSVNSYFSNIGGSEVEMKHSAFEKTLESSRGILFSLSQVQQALRQQLLFCSNPVVLDSMRHVLHTANVQIKRLILCFEDTQQSNDGTANINSIVNASLSCISSFRKLIEVTKKFLNELTSRADVRYVRLLLLILFDAAKELQNALVPLSPSQPHSGNNIFADQVRQSPTSMIRTASGLTNRIVSVEKPASVMNPEIDKQIQDQVALATNSAMSVLTLLIDAVPKNNQPDLVNENIAPNLISKLRELGSLSAAACDVTRKLKHRLLTFQTNPEELEWQLFLDDTQAFVKSIIAVANLAKALSSEYTFQKSVLAGLSAATRSTKDLTILLSSSARHYTESSLATPVPLMSPIARVPATPLSAALGSAAQSITSPLIMSPAAIPASAYSTNKIDYFTDADGNVEGLQR